MRFDPIDENVFNCGFGDLDEFSGEVSDSVVSGNGDRDLVLGTAAKIVIHFIEIFPNAAVFIQGSSDSRTRLYQQGVNRFWPEISCSFLVSGRIQDKWIQFDKNRNFDAFLIRRKGSAIL